MKHIASAAALLSAVIWLAILSAPAPRRRQHRLPPSLANGQIEIAYIEPANPVHRPMYERLQQRQVLEQLRQFLAPLKLPRQLKVQLRGCRGSVNAWYSNGEVTICYEYVAWIEDLAPKQNTPEVTREDAIVGPFIQVVLHEVAHAVFDILQIPLFGREEDAADQLAAFIMLQFGKDVARRTLTGTAHLYRRGRRGQCADRGRFLRRPRHRRAALLQYAVHRLWRRSEHVQRLRAEEDPAQVPRRRLRAGVSAGAVCVPQADRAVRGSGADGEGAAHGDIEGG